MAETWPKIEEAEAERFIGKIVLVGVTYVDHNDQFLEQKQWSGRITHVSNEEGIVIELDECDDPCTLPPDLSYLKPAKPGVYRLRSTGREIEDPDFITTWTCQTPPPGDSD